MQFILNFEDFLITELMSINSRVEILAEQLYTFIKGKQVGYYTFYPKIEGLYIYKIDIMIMPNSVGMEGFVNMDKSKRLSNGWIFNMGLIENCKLHHVQHECNHIFQILNKGRNDIAKKLNYVNNGRFARKLNIIKESDCEAFFECLYFCDSGEIDSMVNETYAFFKERLVKHRTGKISKLEFENILTNTRCYKIVEHLLGFNINNHFSYLSINDRNKFFYLLEQNKKQLDIQTDIKYPKDSFIKRMVKSIFKYFKPEEPNLTILVEPNYIYPKPDKDIEYYGEYINNSGELLKRKLYKLSSHFCI